MKRISSALCALVTMLITMQAWAAPYERLIRTDW